MHIKIIHDKQIHLLNIKEINTIQQLKQAVYRVLFHKDINKNINESKNHQDEKDNKNEKQFVLRVATFHGWKILEKDCDVQEIKEYKDKNSWNKIKVYVVDREQCANQNKIQKQQNKQQDAVKDQPKFQTKGSDKNQTKTENRKNTKSISMTQILTKAQKHHDKQPSNAIQIINHEQLQQQRYSSQYHDQQHEQQQIKKYQPFYICSFCQKQSDDGPFYRCSVCNDVDLCPECQDICTHQHPFVKIKNKEYKKIKIFAVLQSFMHQDLKQVQKQNKLENNQKIKNQNKDEIHNQIQNQQPSKQEKQDPIKQQNKQNIFGKLNNLKNYYFGNLFNKKSQQVLQPKTSNSQDQKQRKPRIFKQNSQDNQNQPINQPQIQYNNNSNASISIDNIRNNAASYNLQQILDDDFDKKHFQDNAEKQEQNKINNCRKARIFKKQAQKAKNN